MPFQNAKLSGTLFIIAAVQFVLLVVVAEARYEGYSIYGNYVSDLGIGPSSLVFNSSVVILGLLIAIGSYFLKNASNLKTSRMLLFLMAICGIGVAIFTKDFPVAHGAVSSAAFFFAGLSAVFSAFALKKPFSWISIVLGMMTIGALAFFSLGMVTSGSLTSTVAYDSTFYLGLGPGGMERMIIYPALMWLALFGGQLLIRHDE